MTSSGPFGMLPRVLPEPRLLSLWTLVASLLAGCNSGTETGNPSVVGSLSYTGYSSAPQDYSVGKAGRVARIDSAWFALGEVTVSGKSCEGGGDSFVAPALGAGDHASGAHNTTAFEAPTGAFCSVELPFLEVEETAANQPPELAGHAVVLQGALANGTPFEIVSDVHPVVELASRAEGFVLDADRANLLLAFDFAVWLEAVDWAAASANADGELVISKAENSAMLTQFDAALGDGVALYRDRDGDGVIDTNPELLAAPR